MVLEYWQCCKFHVQVYLKYNRDWWGYADVEEAMNMPDDDLRHEYHESSDEEDVNEE